MLELILKRYSRVLNGIEKCLCIISMMLLSIMTLLMCYQVFMRYVLSNAPSWCEELIRYLFIYLTMLGSAVATRKGKHLAVDVVIGILPKEKAARCKIIFSVCILAFLLLLLVYGMQLVFNTMNTISTSLKVPMGYFYAALPLGTFFIMMATVEDFLLQIAACMQPKQQKEGDAV